MVYKDTTHYTLASVVCKIKYGVLKMLYFNYKHIPTLYNLSKSPEAFCYLERQLDANDTQIYQNLLIEIERLSNVVMSSKVNNIAIEDIRHILNVVIHNYSNYKCSYRVNSNSRVLSKIEGIVKLVNKMTRCVKNK